MGGIAVVDHLEWQAALLTEDSYKDAFFSLPRMSRPVNRGNNP
jgi:hypothetical protein